MGIFTTVLAMWTKVPSSGKDQHAGAEPAGFVDEEEAAEMTAETVTSTPMSARSAPTPRTVSFERNLESETEGSYYSD